MIIYLGMKKLVQMSRINHLDSSTGIKDALWDQIYRYLDNRFAGTLSRSAPKHPESVLLHSEFNILQSQEIKNHWSKFYRIKKYKQGEKKLKDNIIYHHVLVVAL